MKKTIFKILSVFVVIIFIISCFFINTSAAVTYNNFNDFANLILSSLNLYKSSSGGFVDVTASQRLSEIGNSIYYSMTTTESWGAGQRYRVYMSFELSPSVVFNARYNGEFHIVGNPNLYNFLLNSSSIYFTNSDGSKTYCTLSLNSSNNADLICRFDSSVAKEPNSLSIYFDFTNVTTFSSYNTVIDFSLMYLDFNYVTDSDVIVENQDKLASDIQANADKNANEIKANQDKNTDKILNGDTDLDSSGETDKVNGAVGDVDGATDEALGGKSETEIQGEVDGALDWNKIGNSVDFEKAQRMSTFYDRCLTVFGSKYNSLLLLSLILGLAAFLIGRKYG